MNLQKPEKKVVSIDGGLEVQSIFYTIQGEGPFAGTPAIFIRLAGCNLQCPGCDTDYTSDRKILSVTEILCRVHNLLPGDYWRTLVVITGGEPFRQDLSELILKLIYTGYYVQIETNGTFPPSKEVDYSRVPSNRYGAYIVVSPKTGKVNSEIEKKACCYKYVMHHESVGEDGLPQFALQHPASPQLARPPKYFSQIYLQPQDTLDKSDNGLSLKACIQSCMKHGYILQLQIHKIIGMD